jgi:hypothetical protein
LSNGVKQGDPLSLYLFLLAADGLENIFSLGVANGHYEGLGLTLLNETKILNIQYADDILLF